MADEPLVVIAYSGYRLDERPVRIIQGQRSREVVEIIDQWYGIGYAYFKVRLDDEERVILRNDLWDHCWRIVDDRSRL